MELPQAPTPQRTWYCQSCSHPLYRAELGTEHCTKCGGTRFSAQPKPHSFDTWSLSTEDRAFLLIQRIRPDDWVDFA